MLCAQCNGSMQRKSKSADCAREILSACVMYKAGVDTVKIQGVPKKKKNVTGFLQIISRIVRDKFFRLPVNIAKGGIDTNSKSRCGTYNGTEIKGHRS
jgi:hypothetical protein